MGDLAPRASGLNRARGRAIARGQVTRLMVDGHARRQRLRIEQRLLAQGFGGFAALFLALGCEVVSMGEADGDRGR